MHLYYHLDREGQESCAIFTDEILMEGADKKRNFATNWQREKLALARETQGVSPAHTDEGLVYANQHTDTVTSTSTAPTPGYLTLVKQELDKYVTHQKKLPPRGRHAKHSIEACRAGRVKKQRWNDLPGGEKERLTLDYAFRSESVAFTLNLTPKKQAQLMKSDRPARLLADAINRAAKRILGYAAPISLALEVTGNGRLHAHGIVTLQRREGKAFCKALKSAGGKVHGCGAGRQTDIRKLWSATGWTRYLAKDFDRTAEALGTDKIHYQCRATVQGARAEYELSRARQRDARRKTHSGSVSARKPSASPTHSPETETRQRPSMSQGERPAPVNQYLLTKYLKNNVFFNFNALPNTLGQAYNEVLIRNHRTKIMQTTANEVYLPDDLYEEVVNRLVEVIPLLGGRDELVARLGEVTGIWPEHSRPENFEFALAS